MVRALTHLRIEVDGAELFDGDVEGWTPPPTMPANPTPGPGFQALPESVRKALGHAMAKAISDATGLSVTIG